MIAALALTTAAYALEDVPGNSAHAAILMHADTGDVLFEQNADEQMLIASTTKMMTALVVLENCDPLETVTVTREQCAVEGSSVYLRPGETYTVEDLLYGLMLASGNDAAMALACHVGGSIGGFAQMMNETAAELGLENTSFQNPHGLDAEGHYSSAHDLACIAAEGMKNELFAQIVGTRTYTIGENTYVNHNKLLWNYEGCRGIKTGYTMAAGRSLVSCAERDGLRLICVTLSDPNDWADHTALYDWGFENWEYRRVIPVGPLTTLPVIAGSAETVRVAAVNNPGVLVRRDSVTDIRLELPDFVYADVNAGTRAGSVVVTVDGEFAMRVDACFMESAHVADNVRLTPWERFKRAWYLANRYGGMGYYGIIY